MAHRGARVDDLAAIIDLLAADAALPKACRPHKLVGDYVNLWECHIAPDWLLIYELPEGVVLLHRTGTHADLFD